VAVDRRPLWFSGNVTPVHSRRQPRPVSATTFHQDQAVFNRPRIALWNFGRHTRFRVAGDLAPLPPRAAKYFLAAIVSLSAILAAEILEGIGAAPRPPPIDVLLAQYLSIAVHETQSLTTSASRSLEDAAAKTMSRPIFAPDRRPERQGGATISGIAIVEPPVKLVGTIVSDRVQIAILEVADKQIARVVGNRVGSSRIIEIDQALIRLESGDGRITDLRLTRGTRIEPPGRPASTRSSLLQ
jgi:hypothetical protein